MTTLEHPVAPEEIMAMLDEELSSAERQSVLDHLAQCADCAAMRDRFVGTSQALRDWQVQPAPQELSQTIELAANGGAPKPVRPRRRISGFAWAGGVLAAALAVLFWVNVQPTRFVSRQTEAIQRQRASVSGQWSDAVSSPEPFASPDALLADKRQFMTQLASPAPADRFRGGMADLAQVSPGLAAPREAAAARAPAAAPLPERPAAPMIARQVSLIILVNNIPGARAALDGLLARHAGYAANLSISTPPDGARSFQASLRIPAPQLESALANLRALGQVENESQSGEEVTQQHEDLVARLRNARETEDRLRELLAQRTGRMSDVLEVEEQISQTRGIIEQMEAEQQALEHRVDYASVELQLTEQYEEHLIGQPISAGTQMRNSLVQGIRNAVSSLLALALFLEEAGPTILVWAVILGIPAWVFVRRYRRARARF